MTTITIGNLTQLPTAQDSTVFAVQDGVLTRKLTALSLKSYMSSLGNISVSGSLTAGNIFADNITAGTIQAAVIGNVGTILTGTLSTAAQPNITTVGTLINLVVSGTANIGGNVNLTGNIISTRTASFSAINNTVIGNVAHATGRFTTVTATTLNAGTIGNTGAVLTGTLSTAAQTNITSVGTLTGLTVGGIATFNSNIVLPSAAGTVEIKAGTGDNATYSTYNTTIRSWWGIGFRDYTDSNIAKLVIDCRTGSISSVGSMTAGTVVASTINAGTIGNTGATLTGTLSTAAQTNITSVGTLTGLTVSGAIIPNGNLTVNLGSTSAWFNNIYGVSVQAKYADLAEKYTSDSDYIPGTVVVFGGTNEITVSSESHTPTVAGVISSDPAYLMNSAISGLPVALTGRVPCQVQGPVNKGDRLVNVAPGIAGRLDLSKYTPGCVIGHALETLTSDEIKLIEVVIMKF